MPNPFKTTALAVAASAVMVTTPIAAAPFSQHSPAAEATYGVPAWQADVAEHGKKRKYRDRYYDRGRYDARYDRGYDRYDEPVYRETRVWRGDDGRYYCRKSDGTTGLLIGGAAGALIGREVAGRGDRTLGALLGGVAGALLGREVDRGGSRCR